MRCLDQAEFVNLCADPRKAQERLVLGGEGEESRLGGVEKRLFAETVARAEQPSRRADIEREGKHTVQPAQTLCAPSLVGLEDHLGIGRRGETSAESGQLSPYLEVVVHLTVVGDHEAASDVLHRL